MEAQQYPLLKGKLRFLRRSIVVGLQDEVILRKTRQKGLYVRCVKDLDVKSPGELNLRKDRYLKGKLVNGLKKVIIRNSGNFQWYNTLKYAKSLETFDLQFTRPEIYLCGTFIVPAEFNPNKKKKPVAKLLQCMKKLPKGIKSLAMEIDELKIDEGHLKKIYRIVGSFRQLEKYKRKLGFQPTDDAYVYKELLLIRNYFSKSKAAELTNFRYNFRRNHPKSIQDQHEFLAIMKYGRQCPWVTDLRLLLEPDVTLNVNLKEETSVEYTEEERAKYEENQWEDDERFGMPVSSDGEEEEEEVIEDDEIEDNSIEKIAKEAATFYRFDLFPNLQKLIWQLPKVCFYPLDDSVVKGLKALKNLKQLCFVAKFRPQGMRFIFEGLLEVPLLEMINLKIPFIKKEEWELLKMFFDKQVDLKAITLIISKSRSTKEGYLEQNKHFAEYVGGYLSNKPKLESICLVGNLLTVEAVSEALKKVEMKGQLKYFNMSLFDDHLCTEKPTALVRVQGLCDFLVSQKESLSFLSLNLLFVFSAGVIQELTRAISQMRVLKTLEFFINGDRSHDKYLHKESVEEHMRFFKKVMKESNILNDDSKSEDYFVDIAKMLKELKTVDDLRLFCFFLHKTEEEYKKEYIEILKALLEMKRLRVLNFNIPFQQAPKYLIKEIEDSLLNIANLKTVEVAVGAYSFNLDNFYGHHVNKIVDKVKKRQQLRSDLMF